MAKFFKLTNKKNKTIAFVSQLSLNSSNKIQFMQGYCYGSAFSDLSIKTNNSKEQNNNSNATYRWSSFYLKRERENNINSINKALAYETKHGDKLIKQKINNTDIYSYMYYDHDLLNSSVDTQRNSSHSYQNLFIKIPFQDLYKKVKEQTRKEFSDSVITDEEFYDSIVNNSSKYSKTIKRAVSEYLADSDYLFDIIKKNIDFPILKEWMPRCMDGAMYIYPFTSYYADINDPNNIYIVQVTFSYVSLKNYISRNLKNGTLNIKGTNKISDNFSDIDSLTKYLEKFSDKLIKKTAENFTPLFEPKTEKFTRNEKDYFSFCNQISKINLFNAQKNVISAVSKALDKNNATLIVGEMGVGKTALSIASTYINCKKKNPNNIIMCPGHLVEKWKREVERLYPGAKAVIISTFSDLTNIEKEIKNKARQYPLFLIISKDTAKINYTERPAVIYDKKHNRFLCPHCGETIVPIDVPYDKYEILGANSFPIAHKNNNTSKYRPIIRFKTEVFKFFANKNNSNSRCSFPKAFITADNCASKYRNTFDIQKSNVIFCSCGESLWTATISKEKSKWKKYGEVGYIHDDMIEDIKYKYTTSANPSSFVKKAYNAIIKAEEYGFNTNAPRRYSIAKYIKKKYKSLIDYFIADEVHLYSSSTSAQANAFGDLTSTAKKTIALTGTLLNGYANGIYYILFRMFSKDFTKSGYEYKSVKEFTKEYGVEKTTIITDENNRTKKKTTKTCPGVSPELFTKFLIDKAIFVSLSDMSTGLPKYTETIVPVQMSEQVRAAYLETLEKVRDYITVCDDSSKKAAVSFGAAQKLSLYPDQPFEISSILDPDDYSKNLIEFKDVISKENRKNYYSEKDLKVLELVQEKIKKGENVLIYLSFVNKTNCMERLESMFKMAKIKACCLTSNVSSKNREEWIDKKVRAGYKVLICNPSLVETGLDLLSFTNIIFYQVGYNLFTMRQASRRSLRLNQPNNVNVYFMYYENTAQEIILSLMANKLQAAMAIEGKFSEEGLSAMSNNDSILTRLANSLVEDIEYKIEEGAFSSGLEAEEDDGTRFKMVYILDKVNHTKYSYFIRNNQKKNSKTIPFDKIRNVLMS